VGTRKQKSMYLIRRKRGDRGLSSTNQGRTGLGWVNIDGSVAFEKEEREKGPVPSKPRGTDSEKKKTLKRCRKRKEGLKTQEASEQLRRNKGPMRKKQEKGP